MSFPRRTFAVLVAFLYLFPGVFAHCQAFTSIVVIGDSLTDVGNDTAASAALYGASLSVPSPGTGYTQGRFTDGTDTSPAAVNYRGVWAEQLAALLPAKPSLISSLAGGTDYAYGFAFTGTGTTAFTYGPNNVLSFNIQNMGLQLSTYLATNPTITSKTLFIVWGGANDLLNATSSAAIVTAATNEAGIVQQLIAAGATNILVPNLPPLGLIPRVNGIPATAAALNQATAGFNQALAAGLAQLIAAYPGIHIYQLDTYTLFNTLVGPPFYKGLANVTASSQGNTTINPDTYLFWDGLHPTTYGHSVLASTAFTLLGTPVATTTTVTSSNLAANLNASVTLTASVAGTTGTPMGYVTFLDGTNTLGTVLLSGSTTTATATYTTTGLAAGTHAITAKYAGINGYVSSTSGAISEVVTAPSLSVAFSPSTVTIPSGSSTTAILAFTPIGGYAGTAALACGTVPAHLSCAVYSSTVTFKGDNVQQSVSVNIGTTGVAALHAPAHPGPSSTPRIAFAFVFPCLGLLTFAGLRRRRLALKKLSLLIVLTLGLSGSLLGLSGCSGNSNNAPTGAYAVPVNVTIGGVTTTYTLSVLVP